MAVDRIKVDSKFKQMLKLEAVKLGIPVTELTRRKADDMNIGVYNEKSKTKFKFSY